MFVISLTTEMIMSAEIIKPTPGVGPQEPHIREPQIADADCDFGKVMRLFELGYLPEEIADECEHLTIAEIYVALDDYFANRAEDEADSLTIRDM